LQVALEAIHDAAVAFDFAVPASLFGVDAQPVYVGKLVPEDRANSDAGLKLSQVSQMLA
jgi:hypothetical protein